MIGFYKAITIFHRNEDRENKVVSWDSKKLENCYFEVECKERTSANTSVTTNSIVCKIPSRVYLLGRDFDIESGDIVYDGENDFVMTEADRVKFLSDNKGKTFVVKAIKDNTFNRPLSQTSHYRVSSL